MKSREEARRDVRLAVRAHMAARAWNKAELQEAAGIDANTAGDFLNGVRWPQAKTLSRIETALEWAPGTIAGMLEGEPAPAVGGVPQDEASPQGDSLLFQRPPGLSDDQWAQIRNDMGEYLELEIRRASRQR
jgi:DNA-binding Xre family transcriptional regulator